MLKSILRMIPLFIFGVIGCSVSYGQVQCDGKQIFAEANCLGDTVQPAEKSLFDLMNQYRAANGKPVVRLSAPLSMVANRHLIDLKLNVRSFTHSWSNCPYDINTEKTWPCIIDAPKRLKSGYLGQGYETLYVTSTGNVSPPSALDAWKKSTLHNSIILNLGMFKDFPWDQIGVAIDGNYAALWFGTTKRSGYNIPEERIGLGVTYEDAINGLSNMGPISLASSTVDNSKWQGSSDDKKIKFEISGTKTDIYEAKMAVTTSLEADGKLSSKNIDALSTLIKNIFPEWSDRDAWLQNSLKLIGADHSSSRTKIVRKVMIQLRYGSRNTVQLLFSPELGKRAVEIY